MRRWQAVAGYEANKLEVAGPAMAGTLQAVVNTVAASAGVVAVPIAAAVRQATGSWAGVCWVVAGLYAAAAALFCRYASTQVHLR